jgi:hypothetical protein
MSEVIKKRLYEEQIVKKIAKAAVRVALENNIKLTNVNKFILDSIDEIIRKEVDNDRTT